MKFIKTLEDGYLSTRSIERIALRTRSNTFTDVVAYVNDYYFIIFRCEEKEEAIGKINKLIDEINGVEIQVSKND